MCTQADTVTQISECNSLKLSYFSQEQQDPSAYIRQALFKRPVGSPSLKPASVTQNPYSISTPVFIQNAFSLTGTNYISIHEEHFFEEIV